MKYGWEGRGNEEAAEEEEWECEREWGRGWEREGEREEGEGEEESWKRWRRKWIIVSWHFDAIGVPKLVLIFGNNIRIVLWSVGNTCKRLLVSIL